MSEKMSENVKFVCENTEGLKFYMDDDQIGPFGSGALVNEDGVMYDEEWHNRLLDLVYRETTSTLMSLKEGASDFDMAEAVGAAFQRATDKFARMEFVS